MSQNELTPLTESQSWRELRDESGRLYGRLDNSRYLLEVSYHRERVIFDLRDYLEILREIAIDSNLE